MGRNVTSIGNVSSLTEGMEEKLSVVITIVYPVVYGLITIIGVIGNTLVIGVVKKKRSMQSTTNILLANLSLADLLTILWSVPIEVLSRPEYHPKGNLVSHLCRFLSIGSLVVITLTVSILLMAIISLERYHALVKPFKRRRRLRKNNIIFVIIPIWIVALICSLPVFIYSYYNTEYQMCDLDWTEKQFFVYYMFLFICLFCIPLSVISYCYLSIIKELNRRQKRNVHDSDKRVDHKSKRKVIFTLVVVTIIFALCYGIFAIVQVLNLVIFNLLLSEVSFLLLYVPCATNPIVYAFQSTNYRNAFREMASELNPSKLSTKSPKNTPGKPQETAL